MKYLKGSPYYLENCLGYDLDKRAEKGNLTFLLLNQPPVCNYNCRRCFMPENRRDRRLKDSLTLADYKKIIPSAAQVGILCIEISGEGEPLLSSHIVDIIKIANDNNLITTLITNGFNLNENFIEFCKGNNVTLVISLFSLTQKLYELDNNCEGSYNKIICNIEKAAKIYSDTYNIDNDKEIFRIAIHTTIQTDNIDELNEIKAFCKKNNIFFSIAPLAPIGGGKKMRDFFVEENFYNKFGDNSIILSKSSIKSIGREVCGSCYYGLNIGYEGNILFDAHAGYEIEDKLGNIMKNNIRKLIQRQRKFVKYLYKNIDGFCPIRDNRWTEFYSNFLNNNINIKDFNRLKWS
jgi:sulfatase maturation enzyme AslB (radical SAM superfamily)